MAKRKPKRKDDEPEFLILAPYRHHIEIAHYKGSRIVRANCGHLAWLSPNGEPYVNTMYTCCVDCGEDVLNDQASQGKREILPGALTYIRSVHGDDGVRAAKEIMRRYGITEE